MDGQHFAGSEHTHRKVSPKSLWPTVRGVATDLTGVGDVEAMKFVEPVGNRLAEMVVVRWSVEVREEGGRGQRR